MSEAQPSSSETSCDDIAVTGNESVKKVVKSRRKFKNELTTRLIAAARAALAAPETGHLLAFVTEQHEAPLAQYYTKVAVFHSTYMHRAFCAWRASLVLSGNVFSI